MSFIAPRQKALRHIDRLVGWQRGETPAPVTVEWDVTNVCSLGCRACHFAHTHESGPWAFQAPRPDAYSSTGRFADGTLVGRTIPQLAAAGVKAIVWSGGGEPTLHPVFHGFITGAAAVGLEQGMYTLGGHLTPDLAHTVAQVMRWVVISLDAPDADTYAAEKRVVPARFEAACEGIRLLTHAAPHTGLAVGVSFLLHEGNWRWMVDMRRLAVSLGATYTVFRPAVHTSPRQPAVCTDNRQWIAEADSLLRAMAAEPDVEIDIERFHEYRRWSGHGYAQCHGPALNTTITPDGRVWVCPQRRGIAGSELGDLRRESFADLWSRHSGHWTVDAQCRAMCRLHAVNQSLAPVFAVRPHEAFV